MNYLNYFFYVFEIVALFFILTSVRNKKETKIKKTKEDQKGKEKNVTRGIISNRENTDHMLSKMMQPNEAKLYAEALNSGKRKTKETKSLSTAMKETTINSDETNAKPLIKKKNQIPSSNWAKSYPLIVKKSPGTAGKDNQSSQGPKTASKRQLTNSNNNTVNGKRKAHNPKSSTQTPTKSVQMDLENLELTRHIAIDCEMVGIGDGTESMVARVSLVNRHGACIYDKYVKPREKVIDYRTRFSGIRPNDIRNGEDFHVVQKEVSEILKGRILVGHALKHDLDVLFISHPRKSLRDTSRYKLFRQVSMGNTPSLKKLATSLLGIDIQTGEHNSIEDARTAMHLYLLYKKIWENDIYNK